MKKNRFYLLAAMATAVFSLSSCIYDDEVATATPNGELSQEEVKISATMQEIEATTRAASDLQGDNLDDWTTTGIFVYKTGKTAAVAASTGVTGYTGYENIGVTGTTPTSVTVPPATQNITLTPAQALYFPVDKTDVDVFVYAPRDDSYTDVTSMAFTVNADQSKATNYKASDFVYGKGTADYDGTPAKTAQISMNHALTKLTFYIEDIGGVAGNITDITLGDVYKKATIDMSKTITTSGCVTTSSDAGDKGTVKVSNSSDNPNLYTDVKTVSGGTQPGVSAIIPPQTGMSASAGPTVSVTINGTAKTVYLGSGTLASFDPGKEYKYTLKIKTDEVIVVVVSIVDWGTGTSESRDLTF